jgi:DNA-binding transcriptional MocR family regulator
MIPGDIDTSYQTMQRDLVTSGLIAKIGVSAFAVWTTIKHHASYDTGQAWPSVRRLAELTGMGHTSVMRAIATLEAEHLLRKVAAGWPSTPAKGGRGRSHTYVACEKVSVRIGEMVLCTIVVDYVPERLAERLDRIQAALKNPEAKGAKELLAQIRIIPGPGFTWDPTTVSLIATVPAAQLAQAQAQAQVEAKVQAQAQAETVTQAVTQALAEHGIEHRPTSGTTETRKRLAAQLNAMKLGGKKP